MVRQINSGHQIQRTEQCQVDFKESGVKNLKI